MAEPAYFLAQIDVKEYDRYVAEYGLPLLGRLREVGGEVLVATKDAEVIEGEWSGNWTVVIRFPDAESARRWYESPEYAPLKRARVEELTHGGNIVLAPGLALPSGDGK